MKTMALFRNFTWGAVLAVAGTGCSSETTPRIGNQADPTPTPRPAPSPFGAEEVIGGATCAPRASELVHLKALNLALVADRSNGMLASWEGVSLGMKSFFADPSSTGARVSLHFFPNRTTDVALDNCNSDTYARPQMQLLALPDDAVLARAVNATHAGGGRPTAEALSGAISYAWARAKLEPGNATEVVLVVGGGADACGASGWATTLAAAAAGMALTPAIRTHVVAIGADTSSANQVAIAGGTNAAHVVATGPNLASDVHNALSTLRERPGDCRAAIPASLGSLDPAELNLFMGAGVGSDAYVPYSADCADSGGYHFDDPTNPSEIRFCPQSCELTRGVGLFRIDQGCPAGAEVDPRASTGP